jgi:translation elongation factor EF-Tu-like GTPase
MVNLVQLKLSEKHRPCTKPHEKFTSSCYIVRMILKENGGRSTAKVESSRPEAFSINIIIVVTS